MKQLILFTTLLFSLGILNAQNQVMTYDGTSSGGKGVITISGNNFKTYDGTTMESRVF